MPTQVPSLSGVTGTGAGWFHSFAIVNGPAVWGWGDNLWWQVGDGSQTPFILSPVDVTPH